MAQVTCYSDRLGLHYLLDQRDYENLPLDKVRVLATDATFNFAKDTWRVLQMTDVPVIAMPAGEYLYKMFLLYKKQAESTENLSGKTDV